MCLKNARGADGIPEVSGHGFESHGKELEMDSKYSGILWKHFKQGSNVLKNTL